MAWNDAQETLVGGTGEVYIAPVGTALPTTATASLNVAFEGLGYHNEDGVAVNQATEVIELRAWQSRLPIRRLRDSEDFQLAFGLLQWNEINVPLAFGGGAIVSDGGSGYRYDPPLPGDDIAYHALVCDVSDGTRKGRFVVPKGSAAEAVESVFKRNEMAGLPITFKALQPDDGSEAWYFLTNDATAFAAGS